jgi:uncharacterized lipoprotein YddW (UPF0748 family)
VQYPVFFRVFVWLLFAVTVTPLAAQTPATPPPTTSANQPVAVTPPPPRREFRGAWVASVANIDWPSRPGLTTAQQQAEMRALLDKAVALHLNAIVLQVRPSADALYLSPLEPWSEYLMGATGQGPDPFYDPLAFAVAEAHARGLELHAWFNPFRARYSEAHSAPSPSHVSRTHPNWVKRYGKELWLDPGEPAAREYSLAVILDVVRRYDIDGVHIDDYFYPYPVEDARKRQIDFPDDSSWQRYRRAGGRASRGDWRRANIDDFVHRLYDSVKSLKPWVKVGISPFGIYRPGQPAQIKGFDAYASLYADSRRWLAEGWLDYLSPQLYWKIEQTPQSFPVLLQWWESQNLKGRHLWPGLYTSRVGKTGAGTTPTVWPPEEIVYQIKSTRGIAGASGDLHFSMTALLEDRGGIASALAGGVYADPALVPASPWLEDGHAPPAMPSMAVGTDPVRGTRILTWQAAGGDAPWLWVVQTRSGGTWTTQILPAARTTLVLRLSPVPDAVAVSAVDRCGIQGPCAVVTPSPAGGGVPQG